MVKNLSQLKRYLTKGAEFKFAEHLSWECIGEWRMVNYADTTGFYTVVPNKPDHYSHEANDGKGLFYGWRKASFWEFRENGVCACYSSDVCKTPNNLFYSIKLFKAGEQSE